MDAQPTSNKVVTYRSFGQVFDQPAPPPLIEPSAFESFDPADDTALRAQLRAALARVRN